MQLKNNVNVEDFAMEIDNKDELTLKKFDSDPGYYKTFILPMLAPGHEGELLNWIKTNELIPTVSKCNNIVNDKICDGKVIWNHAKVIDQYQWKCVRCRKKRSIRESSIFQEIRCRFKDAFRLFYGYCKGVDPEDMAKLLCIKKQAVNKTYGIVTSIAEKYINQHIPEFKLGGPGSVVIIDTYPSKYITSQRSEHTQITPILCIAELKDVPTRYWFYAFHKVHFNNKRHVENANITALSVVQSIVHPQSILVTNNDSPICSYELLKSLRHLYPVIVTVDGLKACNTQLQTVENNLETIWKNAAKICEEAQYFNPAQMDTFIINYLWRQRFNDEAFEILINQMCYNYVLLSH